MINKKMKKILSFLLCLCMLAQVLPTVAFAEAEPTSVTDSGTCGDNVTWTLEDGVLTISGTGPMSSYATSRRPWVSYCSQITSVVVEEGVTTIASDSFYECPNLVSAVLPAGLTSIGVRAFYKCSSLQSVNIPSSVTKIEYSAFQGCSSLTGIEIPSGVTELASGLFRDCTSLVDVKLHDNITWINESVFSGCTSLKEIKMPARTTRWESRLFENCTSLESITIPNGVTYIGSAFYGCTALTSVEIPASVTKIWMGAFENCTSLKSITFHGNAPTFGNQNDNKVFTGVTANAYYPKNNSTWTSSVRKNYGGNITWIGYSVCEHVRVLRYAEEPTYASEGYTGDWYCSVCGDLLEKGTTIPKLELTVPAKPYKIANVVSGVHVYWKATEGAQKYGLWRSENGINGEYKWVANPTVPHFTDTKVESGKTYYYKVTSMGDGVHSEMSDAIGVTYVFTPDITSRINTAAGVKLGWEKITGATGYAIYRKTYSGTDDWVRIATISGNATFTWTDGSVKNNNGEVYKYTIRALAGSDMKTLSGCRAAGRTMVRLSSQVLTSAEKSSATSIKCSWTTSSRVTGYEVRFTGSDGSVKTFTVGNYKTGTKTFTGLKSGVNYTIQVRTYKKVDGVGSFYSDWSAAKIVTM